MSDRLAANISTLHENISTLHEEKLAGQLEADTQSANYVAIIFSCIYYFFFTSAIIHLPAIIAIVRMSTLQARLRRAHRHIVW